MTTEKNESSNKQGMYESIAYKTNAFLIGLFLATVAGIIGKYFVTEETQRILNIFAHTVDSNFYSPLLRDMVENYLNTNPGVYQELRYFLIDSSRGAVVISLTLIYIFIFMAHTIANFYNVSKEFKYPFESPIYIVMYFILITTLMSPAVEFNEFGHTHLILVALLFLGFGKAVNKIVG